MSSGVAILDLLQRHLAVQFLVVGHQDLTRPPLAWGRMMWKRRPEEEAMPTEGEAVPAEEEGPTEGSRVA